MKPGVCINLNSRQGSVTMLVLTRRKGERILIGDDVSILVIRSGSGSVRIGIDAPKDMRITRSELLEHVQDSQIVNERIVSDSQDVDGKTLSRV